MIWTLLKRFWFGTPKTPRMPDGLIKQVELVELEPGRYEFHRWRFDLSEDQWRLVDVSDPFSMAHLEGRGRELVGAELARSIEPGGIPGDAGAGFLDGPMVFISEPEAGVWEVVRSFSLSAGRRVLSAVQRETVDPSVVTDPELALIIGTLLAVECDEEETTERAQQTLDRLHAEAGWARSFVVTEAGDAYFDDPIDCALGWLYVPFDPVRDLSLEGMMLVVAESLEVYWFAAPIEVGEIPGDLDGVRAVAEQVG